MPKSFGQTQVIVHPSVQENSLSQQTLLKIYAMKQSFWSSGQKLKVFSFPPDHPTHREFTVSEFKMQPHHLTRAWNRLVYSGTGKGPVVAVNNQDMIKKVSSTPGAIGYISADIDISQLPLKKMDIYNE